jgi:alpha-beta hydrolase superfamily lysophospholipase
VIEVAASIDVLEPTGDTTAVVLVLGGGRADSFERSDPSQLSAVRMRPFARLLHRHGRNHGLAVWTVRYRYRGWNGHERSPVVDTQWALDEVRRRHGDLPVALVGHSMGGRTALATGGDPLVRAVCALAPWTERGDPAGQLAGRTVLIAHGNLDMVTSPRASRSFAERAAAAGARVGYVTVRGDWHAMLFRWPTWNRLVVGFTLGTLGIKPLPRRIERVLTRGVTPAREVAAQG